MHMREPTEESGGAHIRMEDRRLSALIAWGAGIFGAATLAVGGWIANNIANLNTTVTTLVVETRGINRRLDASDQLDNIQDIKIDELTGDVRRLEGKNMRGGPARGQ